MKKHLVALLVMAGMAVMTASAFAQYTGPMKVTVPFNFGVENERLQPGEYTIERIANGRLRIHTQNGHVSTTFIALPVQGKGTVEKAHFIFHRYGNDYFLAKIWTPGQEMGWEVLQGKLEAELASKQGVPQETATVMGH